MLRDSSTRLAVLFAGIASLAVGSQLFAGEVKWNKDIRQAAQQASQQNKSLVVMVSAPWCGYCQQMMKTTFQDEELITHLNDCFVPVYLDADQNEEIVEKLQVDGLPTTLIISPEMKVVKRLTGYQSAGQLNGQIVKLCNHTKPGTPAKLASTKPQRVASFDGTCLVSLRDDGKLENGSSKWSSLHNGHLIYFTSADHKRRFDANPQSYWPVAEGTCLVSQRTEQTARPGAPLLAMIYADRVWFFADEAQQAEFVKDPKPYLAHLRSEK